MLISYSLPGFGGGPVFGAPVGAAVGGAGVSGAGTKNNLNSTKLVMIYFF